MTSYRLTMCRYRHCSRRQLNAAVLRPIDGSEDKDGEITRGHNGYVNINAEVTKNSKAVGTVSFAQ